MVPFSLKPVERILLLPVSLRLHCYKIPYTLFGILTIWNGDYLQYLLFGMVATWNRFHTLPGFTDKYNLKKWMKRNANSSRHGRWGLSTSPVLVSFQSKLLWHAGVEGYWPSKGCRPFGQDSKSMFLAWKSMLLADVQGKPMEQSPAQIQTEITDWEKLKN